MTGDTHHVIASSAIWWFCAHGKAAGGFWVPAHVASSQAVRESPGEAYAPCVPSTRVAPDLVAIPWAVAAGKQGERDRTSTT